MINSSNFTLYGMQNDSERYSWAAYHLFVFLSSLFGDTLILIASFKDRIKVNKSILIIIQHLAVCDLSLSIVQVLPAGISLFANSWVLGEFLCYFHVYLSYFVHSAGLSLVPFLTTCKLFILKRPVQTPDHDSSKAVKLLCFLIWMFSAIPTVLFLTLDKDDVYFDYRVYFCNYRFTADYWEKLLPILAIVHTLIPNIVIIATTIPTLKYLLAARKSAQRVGGSVPWHGALTVVVTAIVFVLANLPMSVLYMGRLYSKSFSSTSQFHFFRTSHYMSMINIVPNFFIYTFTIPSFRRFVLQLSSSLIANRVSDNANGVPL